jgi:CubicO group peptidase (beta-lactamase class C family)
LVSTADDFLAFGRMLLGGGQLDGRRVLSRASVELMTADQLTPAQKAGAIWIPGFFDAQGWGFGVAVTTGRTGFPSVGAYGWNGGLGTAWAVDPAEELVGVVLTNAAFTSPSPPKVIEDFWTTAYQALAD